MSNETKRDVFQHIAKYARDMRIFDSERMESKEEVEGEYQEYLGDYATAIPDDLPIVPQVVSDEIKKAYGKYSLYDELNWAVQDSIPEPGVGAWIYDNEDLFAEAWSRGLWIVEETGEAMSHEN